MGAICLCNPVGNFRPLSRDLPGIDNDDGYSMAIYEILLLFDHCIILKMEKKRFYLWVPYPIILYRGKRVT